MFIFRDYPDAIELKKIRQIVKERRKARHDSATAQEADGSVNVNDNADSICWTVVVSVPPPVAVVSVVLRTVPVSARKRMTSGRC